MSTISKTIDFTHNGIDTHMRATWMFDENAIDDEYGAQIPKLVSITCAETGETFATDTAALDFIEARTGDDELYQDDFDHEARNAQESYYANLR